jgi:hypothetical protein
LIFCLFSRSFPFPIQAVVNSNAEVTKGESARMSSFVGAIAIADLVKTTLGPKGMDKILQSVRNFFLLTLLTSA